MIAIVGLFPKILRPGNYQETLAKKNGKLFV